MYTLYMLPPFHTTQAHTQKTAHAEGQFSTEVYNVNHVMCKSYSKLMFIYCILSRRPNDAQLVSAIGILDWCTAITPTNCVIPYPPHISLAVEFLLSHTHQPTHKSGQCCWVVSGESNLFSVIAGSCLTPYIILSLP